MGKIVKDESVNVKDNIIEVIKEPYSIPICEITYDDYRGNQKERIIKSIDDYYSDHHCDESEDKQTGKVWMLVLFDSDEPLGVRQVAQALDKNKNNGFFGEIYSHVNDMFEGDDKYKGYADSLTEGQKLVFYEINIDEVLSNFAAFDYKNAIYEIAREYMAEAFLAYFTQSEEWRYWNAGMDKKAYYRLVNDLKDCK